MIQKAMMQNSEMSDDIISDWSLIEDAVSGDSRSRVVPSSKKKPVAVGLAPPSFSSHPRVPAMHRLQSTTVSSSDLRVHTDSPTTPSRGLPAPLIEPTDWIDSLNRVPRQFGGKPLPVLSHDRPSSLSIADPAPSSSILMQNLERTVLQPKTQSFKNLPMSRKGVGSSQQKEDMIRIRQPSSSQIVQKLVTRFVALYTPLSQLLLDLKSSLHGTAHINRIIDSYAASTVIKYLSALIAFYQTCLDLRMDINSMTSVMLADIIVASSLTRRSDGCGPSHSVLIKAIRWGHKQFNIAPLAPSFDDLISSFYRTKIPHDRRESLPYSLYILSQFERRVLQSSTPDGEVVILSAFLFLLWPQIIWQFFQFNDSTPSVILENELPPEGFAEVSSSESSSESSTTSGSESEQVVKPPEKLNL